MCVCVCAYMYMCMHTCVGSVSVCVACVSSVVCSFAVLFRTSVAIFSSFSATIK